MFINIHISSKSYKSIKLFSNFLTNKTFTEKLKLTTPSLFFYNPIKKKTFTVLKSPHVNKTAQEHFEYRLYTRQFKIYSSKGLWLLTFLKKLKHNIFFDVIFKIEIVNQPLKYNQRVRNEINPDNFLLVPNSTCFKKYIKILNNYGNLIIKHK